MMFAVPMKVVTKMTEELKRKIRYLEEELKLKKDEERKSFWSKVYAVARIWVNLRR